MQDIFETDVTGDIYTLATTLKNSDSFGVEVPDDISFDSFEITSTDEELEAAKAQVSEFQSRLRSIDYDRLSDYQKFVYDKMDADLSISLDSFEVNDLYSPLAVNNGWVSSVEINMYEYLFDDEEDLENYQKLLETLPGIMDGIPAYVQMQIDKYNYIPNDYMIQENMDTLSQLQDTSDNPFIDGYNSKIDEMELSDDKKEEYKQANEKYVTENIIPAFKKLEDGISTFLGMNTEQSGLYNADGGEEYYNYLLKKYGFDLDAQGMFDYLYDKFITAGNAQMDIVNNDSDAVMDYYYGDYKTDIPDSPEDMMEQLIDRFSGEFPDLMNKGYKLSYLPSSLEIDGMLAYCVMNRLDDTDAVTYIRVNKSQVGGDQTTLYSTLAHEGYPGHMLHSDCYYNYIEYPEEGMLSYLGYMEGWARYVDDKSYYKMGAKSSVADFCMVSDDYNYTLSGLIDVAVNGLGYDAEKLSGLLNDVYGNGDIDYAKQLIDSFSSDPGIYIPYSAGYWYTYDLINDYKNSVSMSRSQIYKKYMSLGPAPFSVIRNYLLEE